MDEATKRWRREEDVIDDITCIVVELNGYDMLLLYCIVVIVEQCLYLLFSCTAMTVMSPSVVRPGHHQTRCPPPV